MCILAMSDKYALSGVISVAGAVSFIIAAFIASRGWGGFAINAIICILCVLSFAEPDSSSGLGVSNNPRVYIANITQTKKIKKPAGREYDLKGAIHISPRDTSRPAFFIPTEETDITEDGWIVMKSTGKKPHGYDIARPELLENRDWSNPNGCVYKDKTFGDWGNPDDYLYKKDGVLVKVNTGLKPKDDDYYMLDIPFDHSNVGTEYGGLGIPQWLWHPAAPIYIFGLFGLPAFGVGVLISRHA